MSHLYVAFVSFFLTLGSFYKPLLSPIYISLLILLLIFYLRRVYTVSTEPSFFAVKGILRQWKVSYDSVKELVWARDGMVRNYVLVVYYNTDTGITKKITLHMTEAERDQLLDHLCKINEDILYSIKE